MDLIERYVHAVGRRLPSGQRDEVRRELRSALLDALEHAEDEEPTEEPTEERIVEELRRLGRPERVAASYRPANQYLIGPELFPLFKRILGIVMTVLLGVLVIAFAVSLYARPSDSAELGQRLFGLLGGVFDSVWVAFGIVVLVFAGLQRLEVRPEGGTREWDPRTLPSVGDRDLIGRGETVFGIVVAAIFLALLNGFRQRIGVVVTPGEPPLLNDILLAWLPWLNAALLLGMGVKVFLVWHGRWQWWSRTASVAIDFFGLWILYRIVVQVTDERAALLAAGLPRPVSTVIVQTAWVALAFVAVMVAMDVGKLVVRVFQTRVGGHADAQ